MPKNIYDKPSDVIASGGFVLVDGPGSCAIAFTPDAALETASRLRQCAADAEEQEIVDGNGGQGESGPT